MPHEFKQIYNNWLNNGFFYLFLNPYLDGYILLEVIIGGLVIKEHKKHSTFSSAAEIIISGIVQGIGFRPFLFNLLRTMPVKGTIKNTGNLGVTLRLISSDPNFDFETLPEIIRKKAPSLAYLESITIRKIPPEDVEEQSSLKIVKSNEGIGKGLTLPPDIAICDTCRKELFNPSLKRFYLYPFISCAACGPRFTIMKALPYDRHNSTMDKFPFCKGEDSCWNDYHDFSNRRFHAQTFACKRCGPHYFLYNKNAPFLSSQNSREIKDPQNELVKAIKDGKIVAIKGIGGVHLICRADLEDTVSKLRERKKERKYKPFAVMFDSVEMAQEYVFLSRKEIDELTSLRRPIVLAEKKPKKLPENIAPGLPNIGVLLPYMGLHYILFKMLGKIPLIFTSGNVSHYPMAIKNEEIVSQLNDLADLFYLHNRDIYQRCDDSVIRIVHEKVAIIRRSRGYVPEYIPLPFPSPFKAMIATGAELNSTGAILKGQRIFPTQHIGNVRNLETYEFLGNALNHMQNLLKIPREDIEAIAHDLHPKFLSTRLAHEIFEEMKQDTSHNSLQLYGIQHHHAHMASLLIEHQVPRDEKVVVITLDGIGYGNDGHSWGGEILVGTYENVERKAHLFPIPMIGGDLCAKYPDRMLLCNLAVASAFKSIKAKKEDGYSSFLTQFIETRNFSHYFPHGKWELKTLLSQLNRINKALISEYKEKNLYDLYLIIEKEGYPHSPLITTSCGRLLDACAALLDICHLRTYRGEPAMRLEGTAWRKSPKEYFNLNDYLKELSFSSHYSFVILGHELLYDYTMLLLNKRDTPSLLASSFLHDLASLFAKAAILIAKKENISKIGISGGVAYNEIIVETIASLIEEEGLTFLQHNRVPPGDAGISIGQIAIACARSNKKNKKTL